MLKGMIVFMLMFSLFSTVQAKEVGKRELPFPLGANISDRFTGTVHRNDLIAANNVYKMPQTNVITFEPGSYSGWHVHGAMTVIGVAGEGIYQEWGKDAFLIRPGDVMHIPAGVSHFHGATANSRFQQIVIYDKYWQAGSGDKVHTGSVSIEEYKKIPFVTKSKATEKNKEFTFSYNPAPFQSPNFNKPVYLGKILEKPNAAGSPEWVYVGFPKGAYNRWHSHKTGQILIATDGVGLHQIKGGKLEVLHPGDVVFCPPGVVHWHGATPNGSFAHIAINPEDNHEVTWYDFPTDEYPAN